MNKPNHLSWDNFESTVLVRGEQRVHRVSEKPVVEIFADATDNRIGIWLEASASTKIPDAVSKLTAVSASLIERKPLRLLQVSTNLRALHRQFYAFAVAVADSVILAGTAPDDAVSSELRCFSELLKNKSILSIERQIGLLGELLFLEKLIRRFGVGATRAWIGPRGDPHDFQVAGAQFEVKTTVRTRHIHSINGLAQLVASPGYSLAIISILLGPAGNAEGFSLNGSVDAIFQLLKSSTSFTQEFESALTNTGYSRADSEEYGRRFTLRVPMTAVALTENVPTLTRPFLQATMGSGAVRIEDITYDLNLDGLGFEDGTEGFENQLFGTTS